MNAQSKHRLFLKELNSILKNSGGKVICEKDNTEIYELVCNSDYFSNKNLYPSAFFIKKIEVIGYRYFRTQPSFNNTRTSFWFN